MAGDIQPNEPEEIDTIHKAMVAVMREIGAIGKDQKNRQQGFNFRGIDDVYNTLHPIKAKYGIYDVVEVMEERSEERTTSKGTVLIYRIIRMKTTFYHTSGESVAVITMGEGMDSGDKAATKAMSIAHKYAQLTAFNIPTKEDKDPDLERPERADGSDGLARKDANWSPKNQKHIDWVNKAFETNSVPFAKWDEIGELFSGLKG
jgi:hypothetical protein